MFFCAFRGSLSFVLYPQLWICLTMESFPKINLPHLFDPWLMTLSL